MKRVYFVRHGESAANVNKTVQGPDDPLTETGKLQALKIAERAQSIPFDTLISSDYLRTRMTATYIGEACKKEVIYSELFRENRRPTQFVGAEFGSEKHTEMLAMLEESAKDSSLSFGDGESYVDLVDRVYKAAHYLETLESEQIMVVTHGNFLRLFLGYVITRGNIKPEEVTLYEKGIRVPNNTAISICTFEEGVWRLFVWNDHAHFAE